MAAGYISSAMDRKIIFFTLRRNGSMKVRKNLHLMVFEEVKQVSGGRLYYV